MANYDVNVNAAECIRSATHIGFERIHNICSGAVVDVPWGAGDWVGAAAVSGLLLVAFSAIIFLGCAMWSLR